MVVRDGSKSFWILSKMFIKYGQQEMSYLNVLKENWLMI
jgi:hypothetical protein